MATLSNLAGPDGPLANVQIRLGRRETQRRWIYAFPEFVDWLQHDLPNLQQGRLQADDTPKEQLDQLFYKWIVGREIRYNRMFKDLMPIQDEVWEMKTADIRIFGWMCEPKVFMAVFADYADKYKGRGASRSYDRAREYVKQKRDQLDLDEPKIAQGTYDALVSV